MRLARLGSVWDLLVVASALSLLSLFLTCRLGFQAAQVRLPAPHAAPHPLPLARLKRLLGKLEEEHQEGRGGDMEVRVHGRLVTLRRDLPLYSRVLRRAGFRVRPNVSVEVQGEWSGGRVAGPENWRLFLCMVPLESEDESCFSEIIPLSLIPLQKVGLIPGVRRALWSRAGLCAARSRLRRALGLSPPACFALPRQFEELLTAADGPRYNASWVLKPTRGGRPEHVDTMELFSRVRRKELSENFEGIAEEYIPNQLRIFGYPVSVQYYILITSMEPLRVYVYSEGLVFFRQEQDKGFRKIPNKWWFVSQLWRHLSIASSPVDRALELTDEALVRTLLSAAVAQSGATRRFRCWNCFQLMGVDLVYNTSLHPEVLEFDGQPSMRPWGAGAARRRASAADALRGALLLEMLQILYAAERVSEDVAAALQAADRHLHIGIVGGKCEAWHEICLSMDDLRFILDTRREAVHLNDFRRIYPTSNAEQYSKFISDLQMLPETTKDNKRNEKHHLTPKMHILLSHLEATFRAQEVPEYEYSYLAESRLHNSSYNLEGYHVSGLRSPPGDAQGIPPTRNGCSSEESSRGSAHLRLLDVLPVGVEPPFTPLWTEYSAVVPYAMTIVRVSAVPISCSLSVRIDNHIRPTMSVTTALGVGENRVAVHLVDALGAVLNTYTLTIRRMAASEERASGNQSSAAVCSLRQECDLRVSLSEPCGLVWEERNNSSWSEFLEEMKRLPPCRDGDAAGRWVLPCESCDERDSCAWSAARWQPYHCTHRLVSKEDVARCLDGKKLLFLGDSTNRGMMHYILERLNGSLGTCDKTHYMRVYSNLNKGRTTFVFAYYPQFWLPSTERPDFEKTLDQLLLKSQPVQNNSDTVIIVGGVHWLSIQHLQALTRTLQREGLQGAVIVVKTLGSGFHTQVEGVHYLPKAQQEKLLLHSMELAEFAKQHSMEVVDTFNITIARYKDFLQGKCACHFHKVVEVPGPEEGSPAKQQTRYRVEGPINAIYSEILLGRVCKGART
ncbi:cadherin-like and PC-esterase domain-containing protein 1 [Ischnura elegans]|uniref:cadherin-like and PC-esterase domain-containing protein 1 n=1 Tax=Ischnura elegans TaxID=197161 RepID=UPI001ED89FB6|nr:cadherin-like and PC-esterase domain-containing protein 1 [Ischnura elegans]